MSLPCYIVLYNTIEYNMYYAIVIYQANAVTEFVERKPPVQKVGNSISGRIKAETAQILV